MSSKNVIGPHTHCKTFSSKKKSFLKVIIIIIIIIITIIIIIMMMMMGGSIHGKQAPIITIIVYDCYYSCS